MKIHVFNLKPKDLNKIKKNQMIYAIFQVKI